MATRALPRTYQHLRRESTKRGTTAMDSVSSVNGPLLQVQWAFDFQPDGTVYYIPKELNRAISNFATYSTFSTYKELRNL